MHLILQRLLNHAETTAGRAQLVAVGAAWFWGSWGFWMNISHGWRIALMVGLTQGTLNFVTNLIGTHILEFFFFRFSTQPWVQAPLAFFGTYSITLSVIFAAHLAVGTPELVLTLAPSISVSMVLTMIYIGGLIKLKIERKADTAEGSPAEEPTP